LTNPVDYPRLEEIKNDIQDLGKNLYKQSVRLKKLSASPKTVDMDSVDITTELNSFFTLLCEDKTIAKLKKLAIEFKNETRMTKTEAIKMRL